MSLTVGIIGGMGPAATCSLFERIIRKTDALCDQDHLHVIIDSNPGVPDRTEAMFGRGESPLPWLLRSAKLLELAGAQILVMPCVTAHAFAGELRSAISGTLLSMIEETAREVRQGHRGVKRIGLLATDGTIKINVFAPLAEICEVIVPDDSQQRRVMDAVYGSAGVKTVGVNVHASVLLEDAAKALVHAGAEAVVAGCTEIPLAIRQEQVPVPILDPLDILAAAVVGEAQGP